MSYVVRHTSSRLAPLVSCPWRRGRSPRPTGGLVALALALALGLGLCAPALADGVWRAQTVTLEPGWNAVYIEVSPDETADEIFSAWPVERVAAYDPSSYLETKQYSGSETSEGSVASAYKMWRRGMPALSPLKSIVANQIYLCNNTNATAFSTTLGGTPAAPRITWHPSSTNATMNFVGISAVPGAKNVTLSGYFSGLNAGPVSYYRFCGFDETIQLSPVNAAETFADGEVLVASASKVSDFSGVLFVSPMNGIDFMTNATYMTMSVKNDSARARPVRIALESGSGVMMPSGLVYRDTSHYTNAWISLSAPFEKTVEAGEKLELMLAVDRTKLGGAAGTVYGGIVTVTDETEGDDASHFRASIPLTVTSDGGASAETAWPKGLWLASASLDTVTFLETVSDGDISELNERDVKAGGTMKVRLPLYVEKNGDMKLLQRFVYGSDTNGVTHVYSPDAEDDFPVAIGNVKRVSSAVLPIDEPIVSNIEDVIDHYDYLTNIVEGVTNVEKIAVYVTVTNGAFGTTAAFPFTVSENSYVNPFRHAYHPSHDGLTWDFDPDKPTPSGDDLNNYISTVKPEIFSVTNRITFTWDGSTGTAWNPDEKLEGDLKWELGGVRHEGTVRMKGRFTMTRISSATIDK